MSYYKRLKINPRIKKEGPSQKVIIPDTPAHVPPENKYGLSPELSARVQSYVGPKGYTVLKSSLPREEYVKITTALKARPDLGGPRPSQIQYPVYHESADKLYLPYYFARDVGFPARPETYLSPGVDIDVPFSGTLRPHQEPVIRAFLNTVTQSPDPIRGGILHLPCAWGKTAGTMYCISQIKKRTLVLINQENLADQWIDRAQHFLPTATIGRIQGDVFDIEHDIVIAMINTVCTRTFPADAFETFGFFITDEAHFIGSKEFSKALKSITIPITLGLTATTERRDKLMWMIRQYLGPVLCNVARDDTAVDVQIRTVYYQPPAPDPEFMAPIVSVTGDLMVSSMISKICKYQPYIQCVLDTLISFIRVAEWTPKSQTEWERTLTATLNANPCIRCGTTMNRLVRTTCCGQSKYCFRCLHLLFNPDDKSIILQRLTDLSNKPGVATQIGNIRGGPAMWNRLLQGKAVDNKRAIIELIGNIVQSTPALSAAFCKLKGFCSTLFHMATCGSWSEKQTAERTLCQFVQTGGYPALRKVQLAEFNTFSFEFENYYQPPEEEMDALQNEQPISQNADAPTIEEQVQWLDGKQCPCCLSKTKIGFAQDYFENPLVEPYTKRQTIIFANCRQILLNLYKLIIDRNLASVGLYIGNTTDTREIQKQKLKSAEQQQVILATYSMAGTGLDIPTLNAAFFITSKSDIEQPAGRPMRKAHEYPTVIYDFVWPHPCFRRQYLKRKAYYKRNKYPIVETKMNAPTTEIVEEEEEDEEDIAYLDINEMQRLCA